MIVDYARPHAGNPMRYLMGAVLEKLEPFALDLWRDETAPGCRNPGPAANGSPDVLRRAVSVGRVRALRLLADHIPAGSLSNSG